MGHEDGHGHDHPHHGHAHGDHAPQPQAHASPLPEPIARGAGVGKTLFLDAPSGLAGDMIVATLVDLGVPGRAIADALAAPPRRRVPRALRDARARRHRGHGVRCPRRGDQPSRTYATVRAMLEAAALPPGVKERAQRTFRRLAEAEAKVHRSAIDDVHFHEVGAVDAICDVVGSAAALDWLGAALVVSPLPMGRGFVRAAHGRLPLPAPATVECLVGLATYDAGIDFELVTPTGAAIVGAHATASSRWPAMAPERIGWGAGSATLADRPNVLRAVLGAPTAAHAHPGGNATHVVLEANVDDATGELAGTWIEVLHACGAIDAWTTPIVMKKGRPAVTIAALAPVDRADAVVHALLRETTSLGVRRTEVTRTERPRRMIEVETPYGRIPVKIGEGPYGPPQAKPEFEACAAAARAHGVPVREVLRAADAATAAARGTAR